MVSTGSVRWLPNTAIQVDAKETTRSHVIFSIGVTETDPRAKSKLEKTGIVWVRMIDWPHMLLTFPKFQKKKIRSSFKTYKPVKMGKQEKTVMLW